MDTAGLLGELVIKLLGVGTLATLAWEIWREVVKKWPKIGEWPVKLTRAVVFVLCTLLVAPVYAFCVGMLWLPQPADWRGWVNALGSYVLLTWVASQGAHAIEKDRDDRKKQLASG